MKSERMSTASYLRRSRALNHALGGVEFQLAQNGRASDPALLAHRARIEASRLALRAEFEAWKAAKLAR